jgi:hypothetical protein
VFGVVVKEHDRPGVGLTQHPFLDALGTGRPPVQGIDAPLDGEIAEFLCHLDDPVRIGAERRAEQKRPLAAERLELAVD